MKLVHWAVAIWHSFLCRHGHMERDATRRVRGLLAQLVNAVSLEMDISEVQVMAHIVDASMRQRAGRAAISAIRAAPSSRLLHAI